MITNIKPIKTYIDDVGEFLDIGYFYISSAVVLEHNDEEYMIAFSKIIGFMDELPSGWGGIYMSVRCAGGTNFYNDLVAQIQRNDDNSVRLKLITLAEAETRLIKNSFIPRFVDNGKMNKEYNPDIKVFIPDEMINLEVSDQVGQNRSNQSAQKNKETDLSFSYADDNIYDSNYSKYRSGYYEYE
jgi:hypothetical protein